MMIKKFMEDDNDVNYDDKGSDTEEIIVNVLFIAVMTDNYDDDDADENDSFHICFQY